MQAGVTIFRNASFLLLARVLDMLARIGIVILAARYLSIESFSQYSLAIFIGFMCLVLFDAGLLPYLVREAAANPAETPTTAWTDWWFERCA